MVSDLILAIEILEMLLAQFETPTSDFTILA